MTAPTTDDKLSLKPYWKPKYWLTWMGLAGLWIIVQFPYAIQLKFGSLLGLGAYYILKRRRQIADINIKLCFPEMSDKERDQLVRDNFSSIGMAVIETAMGWWVSDKRLENLAHIHGLHYATEALKKGKGVILLGGHLGSLDLIGRISVQYYTFDVLFRSSKNKLIDTLLLRHRQATFSMAIERHSLRTMIKQLEKNRIVWYAPDQDYGAKHSVFAPFFGVSAASITATARLAKLSGAVVIPAFPYRLPNAKGYDLVVLPPLENFPSGDEVADATRINKIIEEAIRRAPEQYLWAHRRFKTRPPGEPDVYASLKK